jgi:hypothetical protein
MGERSKNLGGKRPGAGRPKGSKNTRTAELARKAVEGGITPLEYMLKIMRDDEAPWARRDDMAKAAGPYLHPKLSSTEVKVPQTIVHEIRVTLVG